VWLAIGRALTGRDSAPLLPPWFWFTLLDATTHAITRLNAASRCFDCISGTGRFAKRPYVPYYGKIEKIFY
jgi:hypothetical protein